MKNYDVWQLLWEKADVECSKAFNCYDYAVHNDWPTSEVLGAWSAYDRWYRVRDYIRIRHIESVLGR